MKDTSHDVLVDLGWKDAVCSVLRQSGMLTAWRKVAAAGIPLVARGNPVFMIHKLAVAPDALFPALPLATFEALVELLARRYRLLPLSELSRRLVDGSAGPLDASITFDDGYRETHRLAEPVLRRHGAIATTFIVTSGLDGGSLFFDELAHTLSHTPSQEAVAPDGKTMLPLTTPAERTAALQHYKRVLRRNTHAERQRCLKQLAGQVRAPAGSMPTCTKLLTRGDLQQMVRLPKVWEIGSHTMNHVALDLEPAEICAEELLGSRRILEEIAQEQVTTLAYPHGAVSDALRPALVTAGYRAAVTDEIGANYSGADHFRIHRTTAYWPTTARMAIGVEREFYRSVAGGAKPGSLAMGAQTGYRSMRTHTTGIL